jgi:hypothetical protein
LLAEVVRTEGRGDRFAAVRRDGSTATWVMPSYRAGLPHDLVHLVVEAAFDLRLGLWGRVDAGADPSALNEAQRRRPASGWSAASGDSTDLLRAEGLAAIHWYDPDLSEEARCLDAVESCARFGVTPPDTLTPATAREVSVVLRALRTRLRALAPGSAFRTTFDPECPRRSFERLHRSLRASGT